jgi:hypothetical protein
LKGVVAIVQLQLGPVDPGGSYFNPHYSFIGPLNPPLTAPGTEAIHQHAQGLAGGTGRALGPKEHQAKTAPAFLKALLVLRRR